MAPPRLERTTLSMSKQSGSARFERANPTLRDAPQNVTESLMPAARSAEITLRPTKSSQSLNFALSRAFMIAFASVEVIFGSFSSCEAVAVLRFSLAVTGAVAAPLVAGLVVFTEGPLGDTGFFSSAKAGADTAAAISAANRMRCVDICRSLAVPRAANSGSTLRRLFLSSG